MHRFQAIAAATVLFGLSLAAMPARAVTVTNLVATNGSHLVEDVLQAGDDLRNNRDFTSLNTAYILDEGDTPFDDHTWLLHFDRSGGALSLGRVRGSFDFVLGANEYFYDVVGDSLGLRQTDDLSNGVRYQRDITGLGIAVTILRGLEFPGTPLVGDQLLIDPDPLFDGPAPVYHVTYDFRNDGASLDEVRFFFFTDASAAPEPASWALMIGGFGLAGAALRRRRALAA